MGIRLASAHDLGKDLGTTSDGLQEAASMACSLGYCATGF
jgi:hypothetical protein